MGQVRIVIISGDAADEEQLKDILRAIGEASITATALRGQPAQTARECAAQATEAPPATNPVEAVTVPSGPFCAKHDLPKEPYGKAGRRRCLKCLDEQKQQHRDWLRAKQREKAEQAPASLQALADELRPPDSEAEPLTADLTNPELRKAICAGAGHPRAQVTGRFLIVGARDGRESAYYAVLDEAAAGDRQIVLWAINVGGQWWGQVDKAAPSVCLDEVLADLPKPPKKDRWSDL